MNTPTAGYWQDAEQTAFPLSGTGSEARGCVPPPHVEHSAFRAKEEARRTEVTSEALVPSSATRLQQVWLWSDAVPLAATTTEGTN